MLEEDFEGVLKYAMKLSLWFVASGAHSYELEIYLLLPVLRIFKTANIS